MFTVRTSTAFTLGERRLIGAFQNGGPELNPDKLPQMPEAPKATPEVQNKEGAEAEAKTRIEDADKKVKAAEGRLLSPDNAKDRAYVAGKFAEEMQRAGSAFENMIKPSQEQQLEEAIKVEDIPADSQKDDSVVMDLPGTEPYVAPTPDAIADLDADIQRDFENSTKEQPVSTPAAEVPEAQPDIERLKNEFNAAVVRLTAALFNNSAESAQVKAALDDVNKVAPELYKAMEKAEGAAVADQLKVFNEHEAKDGTIWDAPHTKGVFRLVKRETPQSEQAAPEEVAPAGETPVSVEGNPDAQPAQAPEAAPAASTEMTPEAKAQRIKEIQDRIVAIDGELKLQVIKPERQADLQKEKAALEAELQSLTESPETQKEPETQGELLEKNMKDALKKMQEAKTPMESFAALMEALGAMVAYMQSAFDGTLNDPLAKPEENAGEAKPEEKEGEENADDSDKERDERINEEIKEKADEKPSEKSEDPDKAPETLEKNIDKVKEDKEKEMKEIETDIEGLNADIDNLKKQNEELLNRKNELEKNLNTLRGETGMESEIDSVKTQLEAAQTAIDANVKAIETLDKRRDDLTAKKEELQKDIKALDEKKETVEEAKSKVEEILKKVVELWHEKSPESKPLTIGVDFDPDGAIHLSIENTANGKKIELKDVQLADIAKIDLTQLA